VAVTECICIIPARGGSKGIPGKNTKLLLGKPLIAWSIGIALNSHLPGRVVVTTDSPDIQSIALAMGAEAPFLRPTELATDNAPTELALLHALDWYESNEGYLPDVVVLLQPTSPCRHPERLVQALSRFEKTGADSLVSVSPLDPPFLWRSPDDAQAEFDYLDRPMRQNLPEALKLFQENGSIFIFKTELLRKTGCRLGGKIVLFELDKLESIDIDEPEDFAMAEMILGSKPDWQKNANLGGS